MKMILACAVLFSGSTLVAFAQAVDPISAVPYAKEGALAVTLSALVWALQHMLRINLPEQQKQAREALDRCVAREDQHHKDRLQESSQLRIAIGELRDNCRNFQRDCADRHGKD